MSIMVKWVKTTEYGDYKDPLQNHKFDNELQFKDEKSHTIVVRTRLHELLYQCRTLGTHGKHVGSKPIKNLKAPLKRISKVRGLYNKMLQRVSKKADK